MSFIVVLLVIGFGCSYGQEWVESSEGRIPENAVVGGEDVDDLTLFVCKKFFQTETCVGKVNENLKTCRIPYFDEEHEVSTYEVLTSPPWEAYTLEWSDRTYRQGEVPENAVSAASGVYVGRVDWDGRLTPGKIVQRNKAIYVPYNGVEHRFEDYQVLLKKSRPVDHYELFNVVYYLDEISMDLSPDQVTLTQKTVTNESPYDTTSVLSLEFADTKTSDWSRMNGIETQNGKSISVSAKIPYISDITGEITWGSTESASHTQGGSYETTETITHELTVNLPAYSDVHVSMLAKEGYSRIPYNATLRVFFTNEDGYEQVEVDGTYEGVQYTSFETSIKSSPLETDGNGVFKPVANLSLLVVVLVCSIYISMVRP